MKYKNTKNVECASDAVICNRVEFNEFCEGGFFRPVRIAPAFVTGVRQIKSFGNSCAKTVITWKEPDTFKGVGQEHDVYVYESFGTVLSALSADFSCVYDPLNSRREFNTFGIKYVCEKH